MPTYVKRNPPAHILARNERLARERAAESDKPPRFLDYPEPPLPSIPAGPSPRQSFAHTIRCDELLFGGARGGGKTAWVLAEALVILHEIPGLQSVLFRKSYKDLSQPGGVMPRLLARIPKDVGTYNVSEHKWTFTNGSTLVLAHLETQRDVGRYLGGEYQLMIFEQAEQIDELTYRLLKGSLRASGELLQRMQALDYSPRMLLTANPGGVGNAWLKKRFIDPFPTGGVVFKPAPSEDDPNPSIRCFVPSSLSDNPALDLADPGYRQRLESLPPDERKAQLEGDWNVLKGARFPTFSIMRHVRTPDQVVIPDGPGIVRGLGIDYGLDNPFVCLWGAQLADDLLVVYRELWRPGLTPREQAELIIEMTPGSEKDGGRMPPARIDPSTWAQNVEAPLPRTGGAKVRHTGPPPRSIADEYRKAGIMVQKADNRRIAGAARVTDRLRLRSDGRPRLIILDTCPKLIATLPELQRDPHQPEDVLKSNIDHGYDALRYLDDCLAYQSSAPNPGSYEGMQEIIELNDRRRKLAAGGGIGDLPGIAGRAVDGAPLTARGLKFRRF